MSNEKKLFSVGDRVEVDSDGSIIDVVASEGVNKNAKGTRTGIVEWVGPNFITIRYLPLHKEPRIKGWCEAFQPFDFDWIRKVG